MLHDGSPTAELRNNSAHLYQPFNHHSTEISPSKWNVMQTCTLSMHGKCTQFTYVTAIDS